MALKMSEMRRLAGIGPAALTSWTHQKPAMPEGPRPQIRTLAHLLEEDGYSTSTLPTKSVERDVFVLAEAMLHAIRDPKRRTHGRHWADVSKRAQDMAGAAAAQGDHKAAHSIHAQKEREHKSEAERLRHFDPQMSAWHSTMQDHHAKHAAWHASHIANAGATQHTPAPASEPHPEANTKVGSKPKRILKAKAAKPEGATVHWRSGMSGAAPTKPSQKQADMPGYEGVPHDIQQHVQRAHQATGVAKGLERAGASSKYRAHASAEAGHEHLHAALNLFHAGHHDKALHHFQAAIHNKQKAAGHVSDAEAQDRQKARRAAPVGPRARVGMVGR